MPSANSKPCVCLVGNPRKAEVVKAFGDLREWISRRDVQLTSELTGDITPLLGMPCERLIVLGGDGTILKVAGLLGANQHPIVGVNLGKLGYLADYSVDDLQQHFSRVLHDGALVSRRMMLDVQIHAPAGASRQTLAVNDCVIHAGPPYRMIEMRLLLDGQWITEIVGDGLILASPTGSTAHNMSAGGPILQPDVRALIVTPICPHSLTHCPVVVGPEATVEVEILSANEGTTAVIDGQQSHSLSVGARLTIRSAAAPFQLIRHPDRPAWLTLVQKLSWGRARGR